MSKPPVARNWLTAFIASPPETDACVEWPFARDTREYGVAYWEGRLHRVHRISAKHLVPGYTEDLHVCHRCDNPTCLNPRHLFMGTRSDNMKDAVRKGRMYKPGLKGSASGMAKLTEADVRIIKASRGKATYKELAQRFGVAESCIWAINAGRTWAHVEAA